MCKKRAYPDHLKITNCSIEDNEASYHWLLNASKFKNANGFLENGFLYHVVANTPNRFFFLIPNKGRVTHTWLYRARLYHLLYKGLLTTCLAKHHTALITTWGTTKVLQNKPCWERKFRSAIHCYPANLRFSSIWKLDGD